MSELDLAQKLEVRKIFWAMGASTRLNVKLGSLAAPRTPKGRATADEWTDLDVLAVQYSSLTGTVHAIADCKTSKTRAAERVFWIRGVADLFGATTSYMAREGDMAPNARQLALRLNVAALDPADRARLLEQVGGTSLPAAPQFFAAERLVRFDTIIAAAPAGLDKLDRYRRAFYWVFPRHRNLTQLPAYLEEAARLFSPTHRWAHLVLLDLAWLYLVTVCHTLDQITRLQLASLATSLKQTVVGGEQEMREKQVLAEKLKIVMSSITLEGRGGVPDVPLLPAYFEDLVDLVTRAAARRSVITEALRVLEFTGVETIASGGVPWSVAFPSAEPHAAKLASDTVRFLTRAARLSGSFVTTFDDAIEGRRTRADTQLGRASPLASAQLPNAGRSASPAASSGATAPPRGTTPGSHTPTPASFAEFGTTLDALMTFAVADVGARPNPRPAGSATSDATKLAARLRAQAVEVRRDLEPLLDELEADPARSAMATEVTALIGSWAEQITALAPAMERLRTGAPSRARRGGGASGLADVLDLVSAWDSRLRRLSSAGVGH